MSTKIPAPKLSLRNKTQQAFIRLYSSSDVIDLWSFLVRLLSATIGRAFNISWLLSYDIKLSEKFAYKKLEKYREGNKYNFNGIYLPMPQEDNLNTFRLYPLYSCYLDVFYIYLNNKDNYFWRYVDRIDKFLPEGSYCYKNDDCDITIHKGDTVLDVGAWVGDFSAYACKKGATVYAFEPSPENLLLLKKTVEFNKHSEGQIICVPLGVGAKCDVIVFETIKGDSAKARFVDNDGSDKIKAGYGQSNRIEVVRLDDWVKTENIKIDFIKADIEGFERYMLEGAANILKTQQPVLSLCTYHLKDDFKVMKDIILTANPKYKIIRRKMKLFAYVPSV